MANEEGPRCHGREGNPRQGTSPIGLAVWGNPIVGRALVLLLLGSGYEARFLPVSYLYETGALEGVRLLLLAPTPELSTERREALLASLRDVQTAVKIPILKLVAPSGEAREEPGRDESWRAVPWPCRTEELERYIEAALLTNSEVDPATC